MDYKQIKLGVKPSLKDDRDFPISKLIHPVKSYPEEFILEYNHDIKDQGMVGSCVPHSIHGYCREITEEKQSKKYIKFSPGFGYGNREISDYQDEGMYPRECLKNLQKHGAVPYEIFPWNENYPSVRDRINKDKANLLKIAYPYRISTYARIYNVNEIKDALMQLGAVTICIPVYLSFYSTGSNGVVPIPTNDDLLCGYHELSIIGWNKKNQWIVLNSWSDLWGEKGKCYLGYNFPIVEAWAITDNIIPEKEEQLKEENKILDVAPIIKDGRTLLEMRTIANLTGCKNLLFNEKDKQVNIYYKDKTIQLWIGKKNYKVLRGINTFVIENKNFDVEPMIINGRTMIELRSLANISDCINLEWDQNEKKITLHYLDKIIYLWVGKKECKVVYK